jgi:hypothetical protein
MRITLGVTAGREAGPGRAQPTRLVAHLLPGKVLLAGTSRTILTAVVVLAVVVLAV